MPEGRRAVVAAIAHLPLDYRSARPRTHRLPQYREREPIDRLDPALEIVAVAVASATDAGRWRRERARLSPAASSRRMSRSVNTSPSVPRAANYCSIAITRFAMRELVADQSVARGTRRAQSGVDPVGVVTSGRRG